MANDGLKGFPTKNAIILVVTVTGWGVDLRHIPYFEKSLFRITEVGICCASLRSSFSDKAPQAIDEDSTTLGKPAGRKDGHCFVGQKQGNGAGLKIH